MIVVSSQLAEVMIPGNLAVRVGLEIPSAGDPIVLKDGNAQFSVV